MKSGGRTILLVDDEVTERKRMRTMLRNAGYGVIESRDYFEAYASFQRRHEEIDLLLVDVSLPGNNGCELAKSALKIAPSLKVLLMSGHTGAEVCRFYGIPPTDVHFLQKPFLGMELLARIKYVFESSEPLAGTATGTACG